MSRAGLTRRRLLFSAGPGVLALSVVTTLPGCRSPRDQPESADATPVADGWRQVDLSFVSAYLLVRGDEVAVVDLGTEDSATSIESGLAAAGASWDAVRHVILTHHHPDHAGGLTGVAQRVSASFYAGRADVPAITSPAPLQAIDDGDEIFGLHIVSTPGHTAGHISVFDPSTGVLVAGDALRTTDGLRGPDPQYTADPTQAAESVRKLTTLDVRAILPGHGPPLVTGAAEALTNLAASLPSAVSLTIQTAAKVGAVPSGA